MWFNRKASIGLILGIGLSVSFAAGQFKSLADIYKAGKIKFVPVTTITDESMGGKEFFSLPNDIAIDAKGRVLVSDGQANNIKVFDAAGKFLKTIGKAGQGPGDFNYPSDIEIANGRLYVRELMNGRISIFDAEDRYISSIPTPREGGSWRTLRALPDGRFVVEKEKMDRANPTGSQEAILELYSEELESVKTIYTHPVLRNKYITEPQRTNVPIPFPARVFWDLMPDGKVAIGYSGKYEVELFDPDRGRLAGFQHTTAPIEVTARDKEQFFAGITYSYGTSSGGMVAGSRGAPDFVRKLTEFPKFKPPFQDLKVDREGNIWIQPSGAGEDAPAAFDTFDRRGAFLGSVKMAEGSTFPHVAVWVKDGFWTLRATSEGEYAIMKMRIEAAK